MGQARIASIAFSSSSANARFFNAPRFSSICATLLAPIKAEPQKPDDQKDQKDKPKGDSK